MNKAILIAHGELAREMKKSAEMIFGELNDIDYISFYKEEGLDTIQEKIKNKIDENSDYLIFCDLFCGTPYNASCSVVLNNLDRNIEVVSGLSLPLVLELASQLNNITVSSLKEHIVGASKEVVKSFDRKLIEEEEEF